MFSATPVCIASCANWGESAPGVPCLELNDMVEHVHVVFHAWMSFFVFIRA
jgi:hypothetical protein